MARLLQNPVGEWGDDYAEFTRQQSQIQSTFEKLTELTDRSLFYAWSRRAWEWKEEFDLIQEFLERKQSGADTVDGLTIDSHRPHTYRGGFLVGLQRLLTMEPDGRFRSPDAVSR